MHTVHKSYSHFEKKGIIKIAPKSEAIICLNQEFPPLSLTRLKDEFQPLQTIHPDLFAGTMMVTAPILFLTVVLIGTIAFSVKVGRSDKFNQEVSEDNIADYDEDSHWVGGLIYFNKNDPSIFVEKRFVVGWTLNFANPIGYIIFIGPILFILVLSFM